MRVIQIMPDFGVAGAEIMCENLVYELQKRKVEVSVVSFYNYHSVITERIEEAGIKIYYLSKKPGPDLSIFYKLLKIFRVEKPDVIHTHRYAIQYAVPAAIIVNIKTKIHTVHNIADKENGKLTRKLIKIFLKKYGVIPVALSKEIQKTIEKEYGLVPKQVPIVFNGIDLKRCIVKNSYDIEGDFKILHIGRFSDQKNHMGLLEAYFEFQKSYKNTTLYLIGDGEKKQQIIDFIIENHIEEKVKLLGIKDNVYPFLNQADVFVLPSNYEGVPMSLIEAMGTGLPIIATKVGGIMDMLEDHKNALLIENNKISIVNALYCLANNQELRETIGNNAIQRAKVFSAEHMAEAYEGIYRKYE